MKKPAFVIVETILSLCLVASVGAAGVLAYDIKTNELGLDKLNPFAVSESSDKTKEESSKETTKKESKPEQKESSVSEESKVETIKLREEPKGLKNQPAELEDMLDDYGYSIKNSITGDHFIAVDVNRSSATVYCYEKNQNGVWWNVVGDKKPITTEGFVGENGTAFEISEGSKTTPGGIYYLGDGFYTGEKPDTTYSMFKITEDTYWVTDPGSKFYNQKVEGTENKDWSSAEHMITNKDSYKYGIVVNYNVYDTKPDAGSAIFMHCGNTPTAGCIVVPENVMKTILEWLDGDSTASIFITV